MKYMIALILHLADVLLLEIHFQCSLIPSNINDRHIMTKAIMLRAIQTIAKWLWLDIWTTEQVLSVMWLIYNSW